MKRKRLREEDTMDEEFWRQQIFCVEPLYSGIIISKKIIIILIIIINYIISLLTLLFL